MPGPVTDFVWNDLSPYYGRVCICLVRCLEDTFHCLPKRRKRCRRIAEQLVC